MSEAPLSERQTELLVVIAEGAGVGRQADRPDRSCQVRPGHGNRPAGNPENSGSWGWSCGTTAGQVPGEGRTPARTSKTTTMFPSPARAALTEEAER